MPTTIAAADLAEIATYIETQLDDLDKILPTGKTLEDLVLVLAPSVLDEVNMRLGKQYGAATGDLDDQVVTLVSIGTICNLLNNAYRMLAEDEQIWVEYWCNRFSQLLAALASGEGGLADGEAPTTGISCASEPRKLTTNADMTDVDGNDLDDLDDQL